MKRHNVSTELLKKGMVIDQSIVDKTGSLFIARKTVLDAFHIEALKEMNISSVYIREGEEEAYEQYQQPPFIEPFVEEIINRQTKPDFPKVILSEKRKEHLSKDISHLFSCFSSKDFSNTLNSLSNCLQEAISENNAVTININTLKISDDYLLQHSVDVALIAMIIAKKAGFSQEDVRKVGAAGLLHDIGKLKIPLEIINKPDRLTDEEFTIIKKHPSLGYEMIKDIPDLDSEIKKAVLHHHEKMNGTGYPMGLSASQISPFAKILSIADIYDALVTERPYKKALSQRDAVEMLMSMTNDLDISIMQNFLDSILLYPVGSTVRLSNCQYAKVIQNIPHYPLRPKVVELKTGEIYDLCEDIYCTHLIIE